MVNVETGIEEFFTGDHRECDAAWAAVESAVGKGDPAKARALWEAFEARMRRHLAMEEEVLFPAIEAATGMRGQGPVSMMRREHEQMRLLLTEMTRRAASGDFQGVLDQGDTLLMVIQQHNAKEEGVLYPLAGSVLRQEWPALAERLRAYALAHQ